MSSEQEEEKFIKQKEAAAREEARRKRQLAAIELEERRKIREELHTSDDVAAEALELGFDATTARVLPLVPIIEMAWADGTVTGSENKRVLEIAARFGLKPGEPDHNYLKLLLDRQPTQGFFDSVNHVIAHLIEDNPEEWSERSVVELATQVAEASGGFFGLFDSVSKEERELLDNFAKIFNPDN